MPALELRCWLPAATAFSGPRSSRCVSRPTLSAAGSAPPGGFDVCTAAGLWPGCGRGLPADPAASPFDCPARAWLSAAGAVGWLAESREAVKLGGRPGGLCCVLPAVRTGTGCATSAEAASDSTATLRLLLLDICGLGGSAAAGVRAETPTGACASSTEPVIGGLRHGTTAGRAGGAAAADAAIAAELPGDAAAKPAARHKQPRSPHGMQQLSCFT